MTRKSFWRSLQVYLWVWYLDLTSMDTETHQWLYNTKQIILHSTNILARRFSKVQKPGGEPGTLINVTSVVCHVKWNFSESWWRNATSLQLKTYLGMCSIAVKYMWLVFTELELPLVSWTWVYFISLFLQYLKLLSEKFIQLYFNLLILVLLVFLLYIYIRPLSRVFVLSYGMAASTAHQSKSIFVAIFVNGIKLLLTARKRKEKRFSRLEKIWIK